MKRPLGVMLISYFYLFGTVVLIATALFFDANANDVSVAERFGLPLFPERLFRITLAIFSLIVIYGYMSLRKWGFWLMILYSFGFGMISCILSFYNNHPPFTGNFIWSVIVFIYTICVSKSFFIKERGVKKTLYVKLS